MRFDGTEAEKSAVGIYEIENLKTGVKYIGQTREAFIRRFWHHDCTLRNGTNTNEPLQMAWNCDGPDAFVFRVISILSGEDDFDACERKAIVDARNSGGTYNVSAGGAGKSSPMSEHAKKIVGAKNREHMTGRKLSDETRAKMRASSRHQKLTEEHKAILRDRMTNRVVSAETRKKVSEAYSGEKSRTAKINNAQAADIRIRYMSGETMKKISVDMGVPYGIVSGVVHNYTFKNVVVDGWEEFCKK